MDGTLKQLLELILTLQIELNKLQRENDELKKRV